MPAVKRLFLPLRVPSVSTRHTLGKRAQAVDSLLTGLPDAKVRERAELLARDILEYLDAVDPNNAMLFSFLKSISPAVMLGSCMLRTPSIAPSRVTQPTISVSILSTSLRCGLPCAVL